MNYISRALIPIIIFSIVLYGMIKRVKVYECFVEGAKDGIRICVNIFPYILAMLLSVTIFRESGAMQYLINILKPIFKIIGFPSELVPLIIVKPLSGSGAIGVFAELLKKYGADTYIGIIASIIMGSTETIFYTITVYYGAIKIKKIRHTLWAAVMADMTSIIVAILVVKFLGI
ncbi:spore maturation protein [Clostridium felsineum]|uniref:Spore maturation protein B n=1 Tax=Clostridium felsineum TaxID=36839 RepID=A0A1S8LZV4_9CLOT|nr:spore maturation protein [Clostridium felsineum]URZ05075.1 Spore maturation protein B [Clostridium felsineum]URZ10116.1 Spore maturation protein B [Clostridium felsineum]